MNHIINGTIQILPKDSTTIKYEAIDRAIAVIQESGLKYIVCPFETVIEGEFTAVQETMNKAMAAALELSDEIIVLTKWQISSSQDIFFENKTKRYK